MKIISLAGIATGIAMIIVGCMNLYAQTLTPIALNQPQAATKMVEQNELCTEVVFSGGLAGAWLKVARHNRGASIERGYDPSHVNITSDFKPIVRKLKDGKFEITFTSEIAEGLP